MQAGDVALSSLYYDEALTANELSAGSTVTISGSEAHHAVSVSRLSLGEQILIGNGAGVRAMAEVVNIAPKSFTARISVSSEIAERNPELVLVQALAKGDRDERAIEACTEVGVDEVIPFQAARSISRWSGEKAAKGRQRWQKIVREASKQSLRHWIPRVRDLCSLKDIQAEAANENVLVLVMEPTATLKLSEVTATDLNAVQRVLVVIGPEGGLEPSELDALSAAGAQAVRLGETVLRTSTAGVAALSILNATLRHW